MWNMLSSLHSQSNDSNYLLYRMVSFHLNVVKQLSGFKIAPATAGKKNKSDIFSVTLTENKFVFTFFF